MFGYNYPFYRSPYMYPAYPAYPYYANYGINAFQSQLANQSIINTGIATGINQVFSPVSIY
jgi:hypothetical protein